MTTKAKKERNGKVEAEEIDVDFMVQQRDEARKRDFLDGYNALMNGTKLLIRPDARLVQVSENVYKLETSLLLVDARTGAVVDTLFVTRTQNDNSAQ